MARESERAVRGGRSGDGSMERANFAGLTLPRDELKSDRVASELERRILGGELEAGARLPTEIRMFSTAVRPVWSFTVSFAVYAPLVVYV